MRACQKLHHSYDYDILKVGVASSENEDVVVWLSAQVPRGGLALCSGTTWWFGYVLRYHMMVWLCAQVPHGGLALCAGTTW